MKQRFEEISRKLLTDDKKVIERVYDLGYTVTDVNDAFMAWGRTGEKIDNLVDKLVETSLIADSILYELYVSGQISIDDINKKIKEKTKV